MSEHLDGRPPPGGIHNSIVTAGDWTFCRMEHTRMGAVSIRDQPAPFHHLALPLDSTPSMGIRLEGRVMKPDFGSDEILAVEANADGHVWWDDTFESACFYFMPDAIGAALGRPVSRGHQQVHTTASLKSPIITHLLRALHADAVAGQPHGRIVGDGLFTALAAQFVDRNRLLEGPSGADWRIQRALDYIHAHLAEEIDLVTIAAASATSPYHLSRCFRAAVGCTIWRYVLQQRARLAANLMRQSELSLTQIAFASGFETYSSFVAAVRQEYSMTPGDLRRVRLN